MNKVTKQTETTYFIKCEICGYEEELKNFNDTIDWKCWMCKRKKGEELAKKEALVIDEQLLKAKIIKVGRCADCLDYLVIEMPDGTKRVLASANASDEVGLSLNSPVGWTLE